MASVIGSSIGRGTFSITPDDDNDLPQKAYGVYVSGEAGTLHFTGDDGEEDTVEVTTYQWFPITIVKVFEDSSATGLHGARLYV